RNGTGCSVAIAVTSQPPDGGKSSKIQYQGISMGIAASLVFTLILYCGLRQRNIIKSREMFFKKNGGLILQRLLFESKQSNQMAKIFAARVLEKATDNFHRSNVIGEGGYGTVYKGTLEDKRTVAIKKSKSVDENQIEQFINEVIILSEISHPNVVTLLGCCLETHTPLLVYEFVTNKTVFNHLHDNIFISSLSFKRRLNIATQTAEALAYIHSTTQIIHRDIKSSKILLTDDYTAKVSDFGISKFIPIDQTHVQTLVHGTLGYIDPEYFRSGILTEKSDVYSFERGSLIHILDDPVKINGLSQHIKIVSDLAKDCIELEGEKRPNMEEVKKKLAELRKSFLQSSIADTDQLLLFYT
nr:wall-associated receptor kinase 2-like [Tanacetum cinerariifolium]